MKKEKLEKRDLRTLSKRQHRKLLRILQRKHNKKKGFIQLLKYLQQNWDSDIREDSLWNEHNSWSTDLEHLEKQGIIYGHKIKTGEQTHKFYKLGLGGFQYLHLRKINIWVVIASIFTILSFITILISIFFIN